MSQALFTEYSGENEEIRISVYQDYDVECPLEWESEIVPLFWLRDSTLTDYNPLRKSPPSLALVQEEYPESEYHLFTIRGYHHGAVSYTVTHGNGYPYTCPWDSGVAGWIAVPHSLTEDRGEAITVAESLLEEVTRWCNGECYYYVIERRERWTSDRGHTREEYSEMLDSCGGFIGLDSCLECAREETILWEENEAEERGQ